MSTLASLAPFVHKEMVSVKSQSGKDEELMRRLIEANDEQVKGLVPSEEPARVLYIRSVAGNIATLVASYCHPASAYFHNQTVE